MGSCLAKDLKVEAYQSARVKRFNGLPTEQFFNEYELSANIIGSGSFSVVKLAMFRATQQQFAVKVLDKKGLNAVDLQALYKETAIMKTLDHPNVVKFYSYYEDPLALYLVMQYCDGGDLFDKIVSTQSFTEEDAKVIARTIGRALKYCSDKGVTHRDIKPDNILLLNSTQKDPTKTDFTKLVLADFGFAIQTEPELKGFELLQTMCGTRAYVAPEVISGRNYNFKCDIWSLGVITFIVLSGYSPFNVSLPQQTSSEAENLDTAALTRRKNNELLKLVRKGEWDFLPPGAWSSVTETAKDFLRNVMCVNVDQRLDYNQLLSHPWIQDINKESVSNLEIDLKPLKKLNVQRKVLKAAKAKQAAEMFKELMSSSKMIAASELFSENMMNSNGSNPTSKRTKGKYKGKLGQLSTKAKPDPKQTSMGAFVDLMDTYDSDVLDDTFE